MNKQIPDNNESSANKQATEAAWLNEAGRALDESLDSLDYTTRLRLSKARENALKQTSYVKTNPTTVLALAISPLKTVSVVALFLIAFTAIYWQSQNLQQQRAAEKSTYVLEDIDLLASDEEIDMIADLDFIQWLDMNEDSSSDNVSG